MSKRKGVSAEEKRARVLEVFHETQDFFQLKELEKIASKDKGIRPELVKDIVQNLVDDGLVDSDKIGTSVFFWSFPSEALNKQKRKLEELDKRTEQVSTKLELFRQKLAVVKANNEDSDEKSKILEEIQSLTQIKKDLEDKLEEYSSNDPELLQNMTNETKRFTEAANRWTDNIYEIKSWCKKKFMIEGSLLDQHFGIPADLEYL